ncbi:unnamed protein product [Coffea canephora]|uniref:DH200=94 genomic scaffold, scaffold_1283 n=1 Tax=Coffea canephora TaxID=49390 RepID=A0A068VLE0_COFCA|nr:unnamed protein product [Coffea canephora]
MPLLSCDVLLWFSKTGFFFNSFNNRVQHHLGRTASQSDTPRCVHCKKLAPAYEKVGASFKKVKSVLIGKANCNERKSVAANIVFVVTLYPMVSKRFFGAQKVSLCEMLEYEGARPAEPLAEFVNSEGDEMSFARHFLSFCHCNSFWKMQSQGTFM